jgi:hypothetical protein
VVKVGYQAQKIEWQNAVMAQCTTSNHNGGLLMVKKILIFLILWGGLQVSAQTTELQRQLTLISRAYPEILVMGVVYNSRAQEGFTVPTHVGAIRLVAVPVRTLSDFNESITHGLLKESVVQALFMVDDDGKLVTHQRTFKYISKIAKKQGFMLLTNSNDASEYLTARIVEREGKFVLLAGGG